MLARLAHFTARHRWPVIAVWIGLTLFGGFAAGRVSKRWYQSFSIPGKSAYEASQRTLNAFGVGVRPPTVVVYHTKGDATKSDAIKASMTRAAAASPGALTSSYFSTHQSPMYVSKDRHTTFEEIYPDRCPEVRHEERRRQDSHSSRLRIAGWNDGGGDRSRSTRGGIDPR